MGYISSGSPYAVMEPICVGKRGRVFSEVDRKGLSIAQTVRLLSVSVWFVHRYAEQGWT